MENKFLCGKYLDKFKKCQQIHKQTNKNCRIELKKLKQCLKKNNILKTTNPQFTIPLFFYY